PVPNALRTSPDQQPALGSVGLPPQTDVGAAAPTLAAHAPGNDLGATSVATVTPTAGGIVGQAPGQIIASFTEIGNTVMPYLAPALPPLPNTTISLPTVTEPLKPLITPVAPLLPTQPVVP